MRRKEFFLASLAVAGLGWRPSLAARARGDIVSTPGPLPRRPLGQTGENLSVIGFGGNIIKEEPPEEAARMVREAYEQGINYFDVAPLYGNAEELMGPPLEDFRRGIFLSCKTNQRLAEGSQMELERSLKRLRTDYFDLYQLHYITSRDDMNKIFGPGGAIETLDRAKQDGKVRFLGFSAHSEEAALYAMDHYDFDTVMFPINYICAFKGDFGPRIVQEAHRRGKGILALKPGARNLRERGEQREEEYRKCWYRPFKEMDEVNLSYRYTLSQPVTSALAPQVESLHIKAVEAGKQFRPLGEDELAMLRHEALGVERELFHHPAW
ncbi:MAG: aldo/keto reductase [Candidatus Glassbacteria bacterium]|nr:aldo/keto reductase [Candidatus Glassbacteria bacterium]